MISQWVLRLFQHKQELSSVYQFIGVLYNLQWLLSSSDDELTECLWPWSLTVCTVLCSALSTHRTWLLLATAHECSYWPRTSVSSVRLWTLVCSRQRHGTLGPCITLGNLTDHVTQDATLVRFVWWVYFGKPYWPCYPGCHISQVCLIGLLMEILFPRERS